MNMKLEVVVLPVSDIDQAKAFYTEKMGFNCDHDTQPSEGVRVVQLTPPGSACSIVMGEGIGEMSEMVAGSIKGLHLVVDDLDTLRDTLIDRGIDVSDITEYPGGIKMAAFHDPDGNSWVLQYVPKNL